MIYSFVKKVCERSERVKTLVATAISLESTSLPETSRTFKSKKTATSFAFARLFRVQKLEPNLIRNLTSSSCNTLRGSHVFICQQITTVKLELIVTKGFYSHLRESTKRYFLVFFWVLLCNDRSSDA